MSAIKEAYIMFNDQKVVAQYVKVRVGPNE